MASYTLWLRRLFFFASCLFAFALADTLRLNIGGPALSPIAFYADPTQFLSFPTQSLTVALKPGTVPVPGTWQPPYDTYRYASTGDLQYEIPVPTDSYTVALMFAETFAPLFVKGARVFDIAINGVTKVANLDVFASVGAKNPLYLTFGSISPVSGKITITLARKAGKENPMISAISINGPNADGLISVSPAEPPKPPSANPGSPTGDPTCAKGIPGKWEAKNLLGCCPKECGKCGGNGCANFAPGQLCCVSSINAEGKSCDVNFAPCVPSGDAPVDGSVPDPPSVGPSPVTPSDPNLACDVSGASANQFRMNVAGASESLASMAADNTAYISSASVGEAYSSNAAVSADDKSAAWDVAYSSHRWTKASVLSYKIPLPAGSYTVRLLFAEIFFSAAGERTFDIFMNGVTKEQNLDVFKEVGKNKGLVKSYAAVPSKGGFLEITLIKAIENPMISGIFIEGTGADSLAIGGGCVLGGTDAGNAGELNSGFDHRSHSVPGGPYMATDFDQDGSATVSFDGTQSHSHYSDPGPPEVSGAIVAYKWTWTAIENGKSVTKANNNKSGKFIATFPLGKTTVTLEVVDSTGNVAVDSAEVEVKSATSNGAYCYYYDYGDKTFSSVPLPVGLNSSPKPLYGSEVPSIGFTSASDFGTFSFAKNAFAVRCVYFVDIPTEGEYSFSIQHNGPFKLFYKNSVISQSGSAGTTVVPKATYAKNLNAFQLQYFRPKGLDPLLTLSSDEIALDSKVLRHDSASTLPVITGVSKSSSTPSGGENIQIFGSAFINGVSVKFGNTDATNLLSSNPGIAQVTVPQGSGTVPLTITTNAGVSNAIDFKYLTGATLQQPVIFKASKLKDLNGNTFKVSFIAAITYGPDGRLYLGSTQGKVFALSVDNEFMVAQKCERTVGPNHRSVLGVTFSPFTNKLKMFFTTSSMYWKDTNTFQFAEGWTNGKVQSIDFSPTMLSDEPGKLCAEPVQDVVTGLPISNHDHGLNKLRFLPSGELVIGVGGFSNGGVSVPGKKPVPGDAKDDLLGGVASNPLSAAIITCPSDKVTNVIYDQYDDPETAKIVSGGACKVYAAGIRNSFGMTVHSNGGLYATDNGPNAGFGDFSTDCNGGKKKAKNIPDKLFLIEPGKYHGHPNLNRKQCVHYPPSAVQPIIGNLKSAATGIMEYRSNTFGGAIKGNLFISKFSGQFAGQVSQVKLDANGKSAGFVPSFLGFSGVNIIEGPRGEMVMPKVYKSEIVIAEPSYPAPAVTFLIGVHPKQGTASGGTKVLISGHNFGFTPEASFGGKQCSDVDVVNTDSFVCITPPNSKNKQVSVVVTGSAGSSPSYGSDYWYY